MLVVILNQHLIKRRKQEECKTAHSSPPDYETKNIVSSSDGVSCAERNELSIEERKMLHDEAMPYANNNTTMMEKLLKRISNPQMSAVSKRKGY